MIGQYTIRAHILEPREPGISRPEIQYLAYLLAARGSPIPVHFAPGQYGPYSTELAHILHTMHEQQLTECADVGAPTEALAPLALASGAESQARRALTDRPELNSRVEELLHVVDGFESPYGVELLATVHHTARHSPRPSDPAEIGTRIRSRNHRSPRLFTQYHVNTALHRLTTTGCLPELSTFSS
jgi:hypothetical protein